MSNTNTEVLTTAYEKLQGAITQSNTVLPKLEEAVEKGNLDNYATVSQLEEKANKSEIGSPLIANTVAEMTDTSKIYVYTGNETGYTNGNWYSYNGTSWVSGGTYNSIAIGNKSVTLDKIASDVFQRFGEVIGLSCTGNIANNDGFRGWCTPIKKINTFNTITCYTNITAATTVTCRIYDKTLSELIAEKTIDVTTGNNQELEFSFDENITVSDEFYVYIYVPTNTGIISFGETKNYDILSETLDCKGMLKTTSGNATSSLYSLGVKNVVMKLKFANVNSIKCGKLLVDEKQIIKATPVDNRETLTGYTLPPFIYTCVNDISKDRDYKVDLYLDHMFNSSSIDSDLVFKESGKDYVELSSGIGKNPHTGVTHVQTDNVTTINNTFNLESSTHKATITIPQRSVKASVGAYKKAFVLCIGDSQTMYGGQGKCNGDTTAYWGYVKQLFEMDKIDNGDTGFDVVMLGSNKFDSWDGMAKREFNINYKGVNRTIKARAEGVGNWSILHHLRWNGYGAFSQSWWDTLGLGDGTGADYTGTDAQKNLIINTCQNDTTTSPMNVFFDNDKTGTNKFSITKYLERYRTMDDEGNRLTWGDSRIGTLIKNEDALNSVDVCTPTHIILMHGRNTMVSPTEHANLVDEFITECKTQVPNAKIGICLHPDMPGTYFPDRYTEIKNTDTEKHIYNSDRANQFARMTATINKCKDREDENVFLVPCWFTAPTAYGWALEELKNTSSFLGFGDNSYKICGDNYHPSGLAHMGWAYQIYCWIKYTQSLDTE